MSGQTKTVVLAGACEVGKTQMVNWLCKDKATPEYEPTTDGRWNTPYVLSGGGVCGLTILDIGGKYVDDLLDDSLEEADAHVFVFSLDDEKSTDMLTAFKDSLAKLKSGSQHIILVGNSPSGQPEKRVVPEEKGRSLARDCFGPDCVYVETTTRETAKGIHPKASVQAAFDAVMELMFPGQIKASQVKGAPDSMLALITSLQDELKIERTERLKLEASFAAMLDARLKAQEERFNQQLASIISG